MGCRRLDAEVGAYGTGNFPRKESRRVAEPGLGRFFDGTFRSQAQLQPVCASAGYKTNAPLATRSAIVVCFSKRR
jgi:hypothetical protein